MKFYAIEIDKIGYNSNYSPIKEGRQYYTSSSARSVDPTDIHYAKLFPNPQSVKQALRLVRNLNPIVFEVETSVTRLGSVKL
jgi:hypothetical protein